MGEDFSADRMTELFLAYLFKNRANDRHVRRVASWLGLLILGVEKIKDKWWLSHSRQLCFEIGSKRYKARFDHKIGQRGGIEFVEIAKTQGQPDIRVARQISDLASAAAFFRRPKL
jgi:hypothetical protein